MSLHVPAGACILVASTFPIHIPPIQRVLKHCGAHIIHACDQNNLRTPQLVGKARQLGQCKKQRIDINLVPSLYGYKTFHKVGKFKYNLV